MWCKEFRGPLLNKTDQWILDQRQSGGTLVEKNCHHFDLMNEWANSRPCRVSAIGATSVNRVLNTPHEVIGHASISFEYANGIRGALMLCLFAPHLAGENLKMGIIGADGVIQTRLSKSEILCFKRDAQTEEPILYRIGDGRHGPEEHSGLIEEYAAFFDAVTTSQKPSTDVHTCVYGSLLALAAEKAIKTNHTIEVSQN